MSEMGARQVLGGAWKLCRGESVTELGHVASTSFIQNVIVHVAVTVTVLMNARQA